MKIVCIGGGPSGLYFALLMKRQNPAHEIVVVERNKPYDTFGWGVVFSDQTLGNLQAADPESAAEILGAFNHWDDIEVNIRGHKVRSGGHGFCGIGRKRLLNILQQRCEDLGVELRFETDVQDDAQFADADLIIASDGLNSRIRAKHAETYRPDIDLRDCRFVWLGTHKLFEAFTFAFEETQWGWFQAHAYRFDDQTSTFIVGGRYLRSTMNLPRSLNTPVPTTGLAANKLHTCCASSPIERAKVIDSPTATL